MRKDYIVTSDTSIDETLFVESYWTKMWEQQGGPQGLIDQIPNREEYNVMAPYLQGLPQQAAFLDGGCGLGDWTLYFAKSGHRVTGLDLSRDTVAQLNRLFPEASFVAGDIRHTGFAPNSFDVYYSWGVFEHFESGMRDCVAEAFRILKPGGLLFISVPFDNLRLSMINAFGRLQPVEPNMRFYQYRFARPELAREIAISGFKVLKLHLIHKRQGVLRSLHHEFGLPYSSLATRALAAGLANILPGVAVAHMVLAVAQKPKK